MQQYWVLLPLTVPVLHSSDESLWSGMSVPPHVNPNPPPEQLTVESALHVDPEVDE